MEIISYYLDNVFLFQFFIYTNSAKIIKIHFRPPLKIIATCDYPNVLK